METRLISGERLLQGPFQASVFLKEGFMGFASMKTGSLYLTDKRIILEGSRGGLGQFSSASTTGDSLTDTLKVTLSKNIIIPLDAVTNMKRGRFFLFPNVIQVFGEGIPEAGWRIVFNGGGFLKAVQLFIDINKWNDKVPTALKISRHLA